MAIPSARHANLDRVDLFRSRDRGRPDAVWGLAFEDVDGKSPGPIHRNEVGSAHRRVLLRLRALFLSTVNAKTDDVREYYRTVHPLLRVALSTAIFASRDMVVTDTRREPADYERMGLPTLDNSLHFVQKTGYVHAVDLRTVGRAEWKNLLMVGYFRVLGFRTLRHVGTADHLHVSLAPPGDMRR